MHAFVFLCKSFRGFIQTRPRKRIVPELFVSVKRLWLVRLASLSYWPNNHGHLLLLSFVWPYWMNIHVLSPISYVQSTGLHSLYPARYWKKRFWNHVWKAICVCKQELLHTDWSQQSASHIKTWGWDASVCSNCHRLPQLANQLCLGLKFLPPNFTIHLSHQIFYLMYGVLNVDK